MTGSGNVGHRPSVLRRSPRRRTTRTGCRRDPRGQRDLIAVAPCVPATGPRGVRGHRPRPVLPCRRYRGERRRHPDGIAHARTDRGRHRRGHRPSPTCSGRRGRSDSAWVGCRPTGRRSRRPDAMPPSGFYGARIAAELGEPRCPTLLIFGGDDEYIPVADIEAVVAHHPQTVVYPEARHGFMRDGSASYDEAAATDGWSRMLDIPGHPSGSAGRDGRGVRWRSARRPPAGGVSRSRRGALGLRHPGGGDPRPERGPRRVVDRVRPRPPRAGRCLHRRHRGPAHRSGRSLSGHPRTRGHQPGHRRGRRLPRPGPAGRSHRAGRPGPDAQGEPPVHRRGQPDATHHQVERTRARTPPSFPKRCARPSPWPRRRSPDRPIWSSPRTSWAPIWPPSEARVGSPFRCTRRCAPSRPPGRCCGRRTSSGTGPRSWPWPATVPCAGGAAGALREFCRATGIPVAETFMGKGLVAADSTEALGATGLQAGDYEMAGFADADVVVTIGYDLVEQSPQQWNPRRDKAIVCIDTLPAEIDAYYTPAVELVGDIYHVLLGLAEECRGAVRPGGSSRAARRHLRSAATIEVGRFVSHAPAPGPGRHPRPAGTRRHPGERRRAAQAVDRTDVSRLRTQHDLDRQRSGRHGLRRSGRHRRQAGPSVGLGGGRQWRRWLRDERPGAGDRQEARDGLRERDLGERTSSDRSSGSNGDASVAASVSTSPIPTS